MPEYGGRFQAPLFKGEMAFTTHHRRADLSKGVTSSSAVRDPLARERRCALDGKWDVGIGLWFEGAIVADLFAVIVEHWSESAGREGAQDHGRLQSRGEQRPIGKDTPIMGHMG
jgi:hypothetical protein